MKIIVLEDVFFKLPLFIKLFTKIINIFFQGRQGLTTEEIISNAILFFVAGYDTTATTLQFFLYNMAKNPEIQEKLFEEINDVMGQKVRQTSFLHTPPL